MNYFFTVLCNSEFHVCMQSSDVADGKNLYFFIKEKEKTLIKDIKHTVT